MREDPFIRLLTAPFFSDDESKWTTFLHQQSNGNFFQSPDYISLFNDCRNYHPLVLLAENSNEEITGVLIAVPTAAVIGVLVRFGARLYKSSAVYK